jgi:two-component system LytT family sensor kinase
MRITIFGLMHHPLNKKVILYSSLFITAAVNMPRLLAMNRDGILARLIPFNGYQWGLQVLVSFAFCLLLFYLNREALPQIMGGWSLRRHQRFLLYNLGITLVCGIVAGIVSRLLFGHERPFRLNGYVARLLFIAFLILVELKILATLYKSQVKDRENEQLRHANTMMELALLKAQLNPHFLFNALSSLSGVVRENPDQAQHYIAHLSRIFRYSLNKSNKSLATVEEELQEIYSYSELMKMRYEGGFVMHVQVDKPYYTAQLPHMSLQPLIENALKHNLSTAARPLTLSVRIEDDCLVVKNNVQLKPFPEPGEGIGLSNLNERFKILLQREIEISRIDNHFIVKLPLQLTA